MPESDYELEHQLYEAASSLNIEKIRELINKEEVILNIINEQGDTPLMVLVEKAIIEAGTREMGVNEKQKINEIILEYLLRMEEKQQYDSKIFRQKYKIGEYIISLNNLNYGLFQDEGVELPDSTKSLLYRLIKIEHFLGIDGKKYYAVPEYFKKVAKIYEFAGVGANDSEAIQWYSENLKNEKLKIEDEGFAQYKECVADAERLTETHFGSFRSDEYLTPIFKKYKKGKPVLLATAGFTGHHIGLIIWGKQLIVANRGGGCGVTGKCEIYNLPEKLTQESISKLVGEQSKEAFLEDFKYLVGNSSPVVSFPLKAQDHGTCTISNSKATIAPFMLLQKINNTTGRNVWKELKSEEISLEDKKEAHKCYKNVTRQMRDLEIDELLNEFDQSLTNEDESYKTDVITQLLANYIVTRIQESGESSSTKKNEDIKRIEKICKAFKGKTDLIGAIEKVKENYRYKNPGKNLDEHFENVNKFLDMLKTEKELDLNQVFNVHYLNFSSTDKLSSEVAIPDHITNIDKNAFKDFEFELIKVNGINKKYNNGNDSLLHLAASSLNIPMMKALLDREDIDLVSKNADGETPLETLVLTASEEYHDKNDSASKVMKSQIKELILYYIEKAKRKNVAGVASGRIYNITIGSKIIIVDFNDLLPDLGRSSNIGIFPGDPAGILSIPAVRLESLTSPAKPAKPAPAAGVVSVTINQSPTVNPAVQPATVAPPSTAKPAGPAATPGTSPAKPTALAATPGTSTAGPAATPETPTAKPAGLAATPGTPTAKPVGPAVTPGTSTAKPAGPAATPGTPTALAATPGTSTAGPAATPETPTAKPSEPAATPGTPTAKPAGPAATPGTPAPAPSVQPAATPGTPPPPPTPAPSDSLLFRKSPKAGTITPSLQPLIQKLTSKSSTENDEYIKDTYIEILQENKFEIKKNNHQVCTVEQVGSNLTTYCESIKREDTERIKESAINMIYTLKQSAEIENPGYLPGFYVATIDGTEHNDVNLILEIMKCAWNEGFKVELTAEAKRILIENAPIEEEKIKDIKSTFSKYEVNQSQLDTLNHDVDILDFIEQCNSCLSAARKKPKQKPPN